MTTAKHPVRRKRIAMPAGNRMVRIGFGQHKGRWFLRIDLWSVGWRWARAA